MYWDTCRNGGMVLLLRYAEASYQKNAMDGVHASGFKRIVAGVLGPISSLIRMAGSRSLPISLPGRERPDPM